MIRLEDISKSFGEKLLFSHFSLTLPDKGVVALTGPSGCGKTTLLRIIAGLDRDHTGTVETDRGLLFSFVFQEDRLLESVSALENLLFVYQDRVKCMEALQVTDLEKEAKTLPRKMSGGMKRRLAIARALCYGGDALILDEPFSGIDAARRKRIAQAIREYAQERLVLLVTHDTEDITLLQCSETISL
ncbi:MAG: ABC transporter ATP-binding protein [Clostridia bacterium]|nr:ABC transporter ATP-binding protein [Clostridia bacterium]